MAAAIAAACAARTAGHIRTAAARVAAQAKPAGLSFRISARRPPSPRLLRLPVVTSVCVESLLPLHSATASCRMTSMLSASQGAYGWLLQACFDDV